MNRAQHVIPPPQIDWAALLPAVLLRLFDEPERWVDMIWCYGSKGLLVVHVGHGTWYDHKAGVGGDPLDLVKRVLQCDEANALRWLNEKGLIDSPRHETGKTRAAHRASARRERVARAVGCAANAW